MRRVEIVQVDRQVEFLFEHGLGGGADDQVHVAAGGGEDLQQPDGIGHAAGPGDGDHDVSLHDAFPRVPAVTDFLPVYSVQMPRVNGRTADLFQAGRPHPLAASPRPGGTAPRWLEDNCKLPGDFLPEPGPRGAERGESTSGRRPQRPAAGRGELQHRHLPAGPADADHLPQPGVGVAQVPQPEGHADEVERSVGERATARRRPRPDRPALGRPARRHLAAAMASIGRQKSLPTIRTPARRAGNRPAPGRPCPCKRRESMPPRCPAAPARTVRRRQRRSIPSESRWFSRSYRRAIWANIWRMRADGFVERHATVRAEWDSPQVFRLGSGPHSAVFASDAAGMNLPYVILRSGILVRLGPKPNSGQRSATNWRTASLIRAGFGRAAIVRQLGGRVDGQPAGACRPAWPHRIGRPLLREESRPGLTWAAMAASTCPGRERRSPHRPRPGTWRTSTAAGPRPRPPRDGPARRSSCGSKARPNAARRRTAASRNRPIPGSGSFTSGRKIRAIARAIAPAFVGPPTGEHGPIDRVGPVRDGGDVHHRGRCARGHSGPAAWPAARPRPRLAGIDIAFQHDFGLGGHGQIDAAAGDHVQRLVAKQSGQGEGVQFRRPARGGRQHAGRIAAQDDGQRHPRWPAGDIPPAAGRARRWASQQTANLSRSSGTRSQQTGRLPMRIGSAV